MISAFDVYLVMQIDKLCDAAQGAAIISGAVVCAAGLAAFIATVDDGPDDFAKGAKWLMKMGMLGFAISLPVYVLTPSSKTVAAMILVPALTSDKVMEPVAAEAKELYTLAKEALRELAKPDKDEKDED